MNKILNIRLRNLHSYFLHKINPKRTIFQKPYSTEVLLKNSESKLSFDEVVNIRRSEANRSIVVQVSSEKSFTELYNYCSQFGDISGAHHYKIPHEELHYILIEFAHTDNATEAIDSSIYNEDLAGVPVRSPFLWFRANSKSRKPLSSEKKESEKCLKILDGIKSKNDEDLNDLLASAESLEDQILILHRTTCLNDLEIRLRFLAAKQVEDSMLGMFPKANARPFGSSVNGFGKMGCDLDLVLRLDSEEKSSSSNSRLVFHTKENLSIGRFQTQRHMESLGDLLHHFLPGVSQVRRILQARVPIIKYHHEHLNLEVDLSMSNLTGVYMSELFYMFGQIDPRVRPLVFCLRNWARTTGLTNPSPGRWITNFSLTCLIIYFLQQLRQPILPTINLLVKSATAKDVRITEDGINCTFLRDVKNLQFQTKNQSTLSELLLQFFEFYSQFDFNNRAISLNEGKSVSKPDHSAMHIVNPLEQILNVSKNVSMEECERFRIEVRNAAWILESEFDTNTNRKNYQSSNTPSSSSDSDEDTCSNNDTEIWGLLNLFKTPEQAIVRPNMFFRPRMVNVTELFDAGESEQFSRKIEYKNPAVKNQIENIKLKTKSNLKNLRDDLENNKENMKGKRR